MTGWATTLQVVASLFVVLLLVVLAGRFARRAGVRGEGAGLRVVERVGLTRETAVAVVEIGGRYLVVGTSAHGVTLLTELDASQVGGARRERRADPGAVKVTRVAAPAATVRASTTPTAAQPQGAQAQAARMQAARMQAARMQAAQAQAAPARAAATRTSAAGTTPATVPAPRGTGAVLDPRTWRQGLDALRDLTVRRG